MAMTSKNAEPLETEHVAGPAMLRPGAMKRKKQTPPPPSPAKAAPTVRDLRPKNFRGKTE